MANGDKKSDNNDKKKINRDIDSANSWIERYDKEHLNEKKKGYDSARLGRQSSGPSRKTNDGHIPLAAIFGISHADLFSRGQIVLGNAILGRTPRQPMEEISSMEELKGTEEAKPLPESRKNELTKSMTSQLSKTIENKDPFSLDSSIEELIRLEKLENAVASVRGKCTEASEYINKHSEEMIKIETFKIAREFVNCFEKVDGHVLDAERYLGKGKANLTDLENWSKTITDDGKDLTEKREQIEEYLEAQLKLENSLITLQKEIIKGISYNKLLDKLQEGGYSELPDRPFKMHEVVGDKEIQKVVADAKKRIQQDTETPQSLLNEYKELDVRRKPLSERLQSFEKYLRKTVLDEYNNFEAKKNELNKIVDELKGIGKVQVNIDEATIGEIQLFWSSHGLNLTFDKNLGVTLKTQDIPPLSGTLDRGLYDLIHTRHQFWNVDLLKTHCDYHINALKKTANLAENIRNNGIEYYGKQREDLQIYNSRFAHF